MARMLCHGAWEVWENVFRDSRRARGTHHETLPHRNEFGAASFRQFATKFAKTLNDRASVPVVGGAREEQSVQGVSLCRVRRLQGPLVDDLRHDARLSEPRQLRTAARPGDGQISGLTLSNAGGALHGSPATTAEIPQIADRTRQRRERAIRARRRHWLLWEELALLAQACAAAASSAAGLLHR